jgi:hypothetical protein
MRRRNILVVAPTRMHWRALETVRGGPDEEIRFHPLLGPDQIVHVRRFDVPALLDAARRQIDAVEAREGPVDAIVGHWAFPTTLLVPILCRERGLRSPSVEAVLQCNHKYLGRLAQLEAVADLVPCFQLVDPFRADAADAIDLDFPFWLKPVLSFRSYLGFRIDDRPSLERALARMRAELGRIARTYDALLRAAGVEARFAAVGAARCLAEEYVTGREIAHEGHVRNGHVAIHGTLDMPRENEQFTAYVWPSNAPAALLDRMETATRRLLRRLDFHDGCFNVEYFWDEASDRLTLIEVNPRISQSHSPLCVMVDGATNHQVALDVALGRPTRFRPRAGAHRVAAKFLERSGVDGVVRRVPTDAELRALARRHPSAWLEVAVAEGQRLSELPDQDPYGYHLMDVYLGAPDRASLFAEHDRIRRELRLEVAPSRAA